MSKTWGAATRSIALRMTLMFLALGAMPLGAQSPPDLSRQDRWEEADKKAFLKYLKSNQPLPAQGQVREVSAGAGTERPPRKAAYLTLNAVSDTIFTTATDEDKVRAQSTNFGPRLILGGHLFSWVRYYVGIQYNRLTQTKFDGAPARLVHYQTPAGVELALIPLGTPQTRYVLLRGGMTAHWIGGQADKSDFKTPLLGFHESWNLGLGYEWQISDSRWRLHAVAEGYKFVSKINGSRLYGVCVSAGIVYTI